MWTLELEGEHQVGDQEEVHVASMSGCENDGSTVFEQSDLLHLLLVDNNLREEVNLYY